MHIPSIYAGFRKSFIKSHQSESTNSVTCSVTSRFFYF